MGFEIVLLVLIGLWVMYKLGFAKVIGGLANAAQTSTKQFERSVTNNALREAAKTGLSEEQYIKAMTNNARTDAATRAMLDDDFDYVIPEVKTVG